VVKEKDYRKMLADIDPENTGLCLLDTGTALEMVEEIDRLKEIQRRMLLQMADMS